MSGRHRLALLCLGFPALAAASGCGSDSSANTGGGAGGGAPTGNARTDRGVSIEETEYRILASPAHVAAGRVTFAVANDGAIPHEFVVVKTRRRAASLLSGTGADDHGAVGELGEDALGAGAKKALTLDLEPGHYALLCNLPGHYQGGMHTDFTVK